MIINYTVQKMKVFIHTETNQERVPTLLVVLLQANTWNVRVKRINKY